MAGVHLTMPRAVKRVRVLAWSLSMKLNCAMYLRVKGESENYTRSTWQQSGMRQRK